MAPEWLDLNEQEVPQEADMEAAFSHLPPGMTRLPNNTPKLKRVQVYLVSVALLSLVHLLMADQFLSPANVWHMLESEVQAVGVSQRVVPLI